MILRMAQRVFYLLLVCLRWAVVSGVAAPASGETAKPTEADRETDVRHLREIHAALFAFKKDQGTFPAFLSDLVPKYLPQETLVSPAKAKGAPPVSGGSEEHADPKIEPSYGYEFSSKEFRAGRSFAEVKEVQLAEYGPVVPILRCFHYGRVINLSYGGDIFETELNWETDPATLELVKKYGWGPGAKGGEGIKVSVRSATGVPVAGAEVRAAERRANTLWLPERPFFTDAEGHVRIALGPNRGESPLKLTVRARGFSPESREWTAGNVPATQDLLLKPALLVGGVVKSTAGAPLDAATIRIYWQKRVSGTLKETLAETVNTGPDGRWWSSAAPLEAESLWFEVSQPDCLSEEFEESWTESAGRRVSRDALRSEQAVFVLPPALHLRGTVKSEKGDPIAGAAVRYSRPGESRQKLPKTVAGADGTFQFTIGEDSEVQVIVSAEGYQEYTSKVRFGGKDASLEVTLKPQ
ncbi:MAG: carboxypeptidase regulatory-like domain-containing protein [Verrucomicrobiales bacterium]|nr:carboxypeptidase regulatory-like domain-containing protein [Verrucomicrobiales bacterium]